MPDKTLDRLSYLDASFLALESPETHMHVGSVAVFDGEGICRDGSIDIGRVRRFIAARLDLIPRYRQRLAWIPFDTHPVWVDDDEFDLNYHVRHTSLPAPGGDEELKRLAGRVMGQKLDRAKPLWEVWLVEGLDGGRVGLISKVHHCMIDGLSGNELMAVMYGLAPTSEIAEPAPWEPRPVPTGAELVVGDVARRLRGTLDRVSSASLALDHAQAVALNTAKKSVAVAASLSSGWLRKGDKNPLNKPIGPNRRFDWAEVDLAEVKAIRRSLGGSVNDIVLATVAGAVRRFLTEHRGLDVSDMDYRIMAPVSVRSDQDKSSLGNQVAMWLVNLPISDPDPVSRLAAVSRETMKLKKTDQATGAATLVKMSAGAPLTLVSLGTRLASGRRPFNITVTNVPGPQVPLYLLESKLLHQYALVPLWRTHGYGVAVFSYDGHMSWGVNADWDLMPDVDALISCIEASHAELLAAANA